MYIYKMYHTDTHTYDGKINPSTLCHSVQNLSLIEKRDKGNDLLKYVNPKSKYFLSKIIDDIGTKNNIDETNNINADDLICLAWNYRHNKDFINLLNEQLMDMSTGFCPQGRTHRLYQLILAYTN